MGSVAGHGPERRQPGLRKGEFAGLVGPSGSGKTTFLNIVGSLDTPTSGSADVLGLKVETLSHREAAALRNRSIGFIFQTFNLLPVYTAYENVEFPLLLLKTPAAAAAEKWSWTPWTGSGSPTGPARARRSCRAAKASAWPSPAPWSSARRCCWPTSPRPTWTPRIPTISCRTMEKLNRELGTSFLFATHDEKVIGYLRRKITLVDGRVAKDETLPGRAGQGA